MSNRPVMGIDIDFVNDPSSVTETWTSVKSYATAKPGQVILSCKRGRNYERSRTTAGDLHLSLDNTQGHLDAQNAASPFINGTANPGGAPGAIKPKRRIRVQATWDGITYGLWRGYINEWPQEWSNAGFYGKANVQASDAIAVLAQIDLLPTVLTEMLEDEPLAIYRCNDSEGATSAGNSGSTPQPLSAIVAGSTAATADDFAFGHDGPATNSYLDGDPTSSLLLTPTWSGFTNTSGYCLKTADLGVGPLVQIAGGFAIEGWFHSDTLNNNGSRLFQQHDRDGVEQVSLIVTFNPFFATDGTVSFSVSDKASGASYRIGSTVICATGLDGGWHHVMAWLDADLVTPHLYVDGVAQTASTSIAGAPLTWDAPYINLWGGNVTAHNPQGDHFFNGSMKNLALYDVPMTAARALAHYQAGRTFHGELSGARIERLLDAAAWPTALRDIDTGDSPVGSQALEKTKCLSALEQVLDTEQGNLFIDRDGQVAFRSRRSRHNGTAAAAFGEQENPYVEGLRIQTDEKDIVNDWTVNRAGGITVQNVDPDSQREYFPSSGSLSTIAVDDATVVYTAEHLLNRYAQPIERIPQLVLDPQGDPSLWPEVLGREIGDQITVTRRPGGAVTKTADFFIEHIAHEISAGSWKTTWMLSPASVEQVFELESDHGRLGGSCPLSADITDSQVLIAVNANIVAYSTTAVPYDVMCEQERMTVTAAAAPGFAQTLTVTRGVGGTTAAAHLLGADVTLVDTYGLAF